MVVGAGIYEVSTVVENIGFLATNLSEQALLMAAAPPVVVELESQDDIHVLHGSRRQEVGHLAGRGSRPTTYSRFYDWPASSRAVRWTVRAAPDHPLELTLRAGCPRAGFVQAALRIEAGGLGHSSPAAAGRAP